MTFREARGLIKFWLDSGVTIIRMREDGSRGPPYTAIRWRLLADPASKWSQQFGGRFYERGDGSLVWFWEEDLQHANDVRAA